MSRQISVRLALAGASVMCLTPALAQGQRISLGKIEKLIGIKTPDALIAREIRNSGLDFAPSKSTVEALRKRGAGPETLEAVRSLIWVGGYLTVDPVPIGASVEVKGPGVSHAGPTVNLPLKPGTYLVSVSKKNLRTETRTVRIEDGSHPTLSIVLSADPVYVLGMERSLDSMLSSSYTPPEQTLRKARELQEIVPNNALALNAVARIYWNLSKPEEFKAAALDTLSRGKELALTLMHGDSAPRGGRALHKIQLILGNRELGFDPATDGRFACEQPRISLPYSAFQEIQATEGERNETSLLLRYGQSGSTRRLNLFLEGSRLERSWFDSVSGRMVRDEAGRVFPPAKATPLPMLRALAELAQGLAKKTGQTTPVSSSPQKAEAPSPAVSAPRVEGAVRNAQGQWEATFQVGQASFRMVLIPDGTFLMGEPGDGQHTVNINQSFWMGKFEVTQAQFKAVMGEAVQPSRAVQPAVGPLSSLLRKATGPADPNKGLPPETPMLGVSWIDAIVLCGKLDRQTKTKGKWRIPSEAEWEYACRSGSNDPTHGPIESIAWIRSNSGGTPHPVGLKAPNAWGLHDMLGNVREWCMDGWHASLRGAPSNGQAWEADYRARPSAGYYSSETETQRVTRGGSWQEDASFTTAFSRTSRGETTPHKTQGLRLMFVPDPLAGEAPMALPAGGQ